MPTHFEISRILIDAPAAKVWDALTSPELVKRWQFGSDLVTDWQVGSPIRFRTEWEGAVFEQWGFVLDFDPEKRLRYSLFAPRPGVEDRPENYFTMEYRLETQGEATLLTIVKEDSRPGVEDGTVEEDGKNPVLTGLKTLIEAPA